MLRTPSAIEGEGGAITETKAREKNRMLQVRDQMAQLAAKNGLKVSPGIQAALLPTLVVNDMGAGKTVDRWDEWTAETKAKHQNGNGHGPSLNIEMLRLLPTPKARDSQPEGYEAGLRRSQPQVGTIIKGLVENDPRVLLPTPTTRDYKDGTEPHEREGIVQTDTVARAVFNSGEVELMGTPRTSSKNGATQKQVDAGAPKARIEDQVLTTNWGKFEPAIRRWESILGRPAPEPTKPDGKDGAHRLSSRFTEWMMGLPDGWITDCGLSRNDELKACGNGVVPQQAYLALSELLEGVEF